MNPDPHEPMTFTLTRAHAQALIRSTFGLPRKGKYSPCGTDEADLLIEARTVLNIAYGDGSVARGRPVCIAYRVVDQNPGHTTIRLFIGRTPGARGNSGQIVIRTDELDALTAAGWERIA